MEDRLEAELILSRAMRLVTSLNLMDSQMENVGLPSSEYPFSSLECGNNFQEDTWHGWGSGCLQRVLNI